MKTIVALLCVAICGCAAKLPAKADMPSAILAAQARATAPRTVADILAHNSPVVEIPTEHPIDAVSQLKMKGANEGHGYVLLSNHVWGFEHWEIVKDAGGKAHLDLTWRPIGTWTESAMAFHNVVDEGPASVTLTTNPPPPGTAVQMQATGPLPSGSPPPGAVVSPSPGTK